MKDLKRLWKEQQVRMKLKAEGLDPTQTNSPGTVVDDAAVGTVAWSNPDNAKVSDNAYADTLNIYEVDWTYRDVIVKIVKSDGTLGTENKADTVNNWPSVDTYVSYGGAADLWSETWSATDINDIDFGVVLSAKETGGTQSHYLKATNFGFSIPSGATINGILVEIEKRDSLAFSISKALVDHIRITVYYTEAAKPKGTIAIHAKLVGVI